MLFESTTCHSRESAPDLRKHNPNPVPGSKIEDAPGWLVGTYNLLIGDAIEACTNFSGWCIVEGGAVVFKPAKGAKYLDDGAGWIRSLFKGGDDVANAGVRTCLNSFTGDTLVLMADGTKKPIKDIKLGDKVMATDPETGESGPRKVVDLIRHGGPHAMVAVRLSDGSTIDATDRHPFWVESRGTWVDAIDLQPGDVVIDSNGDQLTVTSLGISEQDLTAYNLTVAGLHTYYVGDEPVLVHNAACPTGLRGASDGLTSIFGGGSVRGRSIADIRAGLLDDGFTQGLTKNKSGYLLTNSADEQVRIMSRGGGWDIRVRNAAGNYLDEFGNVASPGSTHSIEVFPR